MNRWLQSFAYQVDIDPGLFVFSGIVVWGIALMTIGYQALRTALSDPVKALRYE